MNVLIAGGAGYFGTLLVQFLHARGMRCRILDIHHAHDLPADVEQIQGDVRDESILATATAGMDAVVNSIAMVPLAKDRELFREVNEGGTLKLLQASRQQGVQRFVQISSSAVYGVPATQPVTEETPRRPQDPYGASKNRAEDHCRRFLQEGMLVSILRPRTLLGAGRLGIFQVLFEWVRRGRRIPVLAGPETPYQFLHATDLASAVWSALQKSVAGEFNVGAADYASIHEGLSALCEKADTGATVVQLPRAPLEWAMRLSHQLHISPLAPYHALMYGRAMYFDCERAQRELGWQPQWSNDDMLLESYQQYLKLHAAGTSDRAGSLHQRPIKSALLEAFSQALTRLPIGKKMS